MAVDPVDYLTLNGTTLLCDGVQAGKSVSEFTAGLKIGRATYDDRQHAFYTVLDDFSGGFGYRQLDIREALGTHWDNEGAVDLRRARHITLPPARYVLSPDHEPGAIILSSEILDGAALNVPTEDPAGVLSDYFYYGAGDTVYRVTSVRNALTRVQQMTFHAVDGPVKSGAANTPEKMTRLFLFRGVSGTRRLYLITANSNAAGSSSRYLYSEDPGAAAPTWVEGTKAIWDAIVAPVGPYGANIVIAQEVGTMQFMYSADPTDGATDWNPDMDPPDDAPLWTPHSICRFTGIAVLPNTPGLGVYFIDYGDGRLYVYNHYVRKAFPIEIGDFHYLVNGVVWQGNVVVTDGWNIWLYTPGGGGTETVRKIGLWSKDGVPTSLHEGRYRIVGLIDGGDQLFAVAERTALGKDGTTSTLGFLVYAYNGAGWSLHVEAQEAAATSTTEAVNPIAAVIDRYPSGVYTAANIQKQTTRSLNVLCQMHPDAAVKVKLWTIRWPEMGSVPIDWVDEFDADPLVTHQFQTGWIDGGFNDLYGALHYMKVDLQSTGGTGSVKIEYRLDDDESQAFTLLGTVSSFNDIAGSVILWFELAGEEGDKAGVPFRTVQFQITLQRAPTSTLTGDITDVQTTLPVGDRSEYPVSGIVMIDDEAIIYSGGGRVSGAGNLTGCTRGARGTTKVAHSEDDGVNCQNRTPELRAMTLVYGKKAKLRKTWTVLVDVDKMVEQGTLVDTDDDGTPDAAATHQNVWDFLETLWDKQTLVKLVLPEMEPTGDNVRVQIADMTYVQDDNRATETARGRINLSLLQPVRP